MKVFQKKKKLCKRILYVLSKTPVNNIQNILIKDKLKRSNVDINKLKRQIINLKF